ncbi:hypothetical protein BGZ80_003598 [Entomortierella chlamydospora]|uniref:Uncharacterized protein n=1 Tax=Entomortierella chlamydospora TaxID=101097 RepID=A0A9P6MPA6_9FUNG|nr:hypothetical protein BGZ80_003598 [Entomortierella chlamydospora]
MDFLVEILPELTDEESDQASLGVHVQGSVLHTSIGGDLGFVGDSMDVVLQEGPCKGQTPRPAPLDTEHSSQNGHWGPLDSLGFPSDPITECREWL